MLITLFCNANYNSGFIRKFMLGALSLMLALPPTIAQADTTRLSEVCEKTDVTTVWFEAIFESVILTTTALGEREGNEVKRTLTFQNGRSIDLPSGRNFLYDADNISCDTYIAVAKSSVIVSLASGKVFTDLPEDYRLIMRGQNPCLSPDQSEACYMLDLELLFMSEFIDNDVQKFENEQHLILTLREGPFGVTTYALSWPELLLTELFYEGT